ncbi:MAG: NDP-sugar synthase [Solirubrobacteraceae bacterium]|nr:NDP-sugar synthase [Solirubrobacteraceae bacterium]
MRAVVLVGGEGTRLRPLTSTVPKPVVRLVDRPFLAYMLEWLARHGIEDVVLACGFLPTRLREALGDGHRHGVRLHYIVEPEPRGTGGAIRFADEALDGGLGERFLALNGDVLTDLDLRAQIDAHEAAGARATLGLVPVDDPTAYGLVRLAHGGAVRGFLEKPEPHEIDTNLISAGAYVLERDVLDLIAPGRGVSIEREVWPLLVGDGLHGVAHESAYWLDIGTPERYLRGSQDILAGAVRSAVRERLDSHGLAHGAGCSIEGQLRGPAVLGDGCRIAAGAVVGPGAVLGDRVVVEPGATIEQAVVLDGAHVGRGARVSGAIVSPGARVGPDCLVTGAAVVGPDATLGAGNVLDRGMRLFAGVELPDGAVAF